MPPKDLPKEVSCQVAFSELQGEGPGMTHEGIANITSLGRRGRSPAGPVAAT